MRHLKKEFWPFKVTVNGYDSYHKNCKRINVMTIATNIHINAEIVIALFLLFI